MPYARKRMGRRRRRAPGRFRRRRGYRKRRSNIPRTSLLGNKKAVKFKYHDEVIMSATGAGLATGHLFSCNGMFDPNITGTGHQPRGFDQLMVLFDHYVVIGAKCVARFLTVSDDAVLDNSLSQNVGIVMRDVNTIQVQPDDILEDRNVSWRAISNFRAGNPVTVSRKFSPKRFLGISHPLSSAELKGTLNSNPSEQAYFQIFIAPVGILSAGSVTVTVDITYIAVLIEPRLPPVS